LAASLGASLVVAACSETARYRTLSFFFDGVPPPGASAAESDTQETAAVVPEEPGTPARQVARRVFHNHPPYQEGRCGACHNPDGGQLFRTLEEGLCQTCHSSIPGDTGYVHGPVAVNACLFCHHYHRSPNPKLLLDDAKATCLRCHERDSLTEGRYHATIEVQTCLACHDPHEGDNPYFLKPPGSWGQYVHGPVAVGDCDFCHNYRASTPPDASLDELAELCFRCHDREDLSEGRHHTAVAEQPCIECHDPHGADNRFFLKRTER
jgi:predicted CXXCH cytochrome family protein